MIRKGGYGLAGLCRFYGVTRQAYYRRRGRMERIAWEEGVILGLVREQRRLHPRMGVRKLRVLLEGELAELGIRYGRDRWFALLGSAGLLVKRRRRRGYGTQSRHRFRTYPNLIKGLRADRVNRIWVSDITYLRTLEGFCYLSLITDAYSRKIVGYCLSGSLTVEGSLSALEMALKGLENGEDLIHHSDRGVQYCCEAYVGLLRQHGVQISMTEDLHVYENALAERVNGILKQEYGLGETLRDRRVAGDLVKEAVILYNQARPHMGIDYLTPSQKHAA